MTKKPLREIHRKQLEIARRVRTSIYIPPRYEPLWRTMMLHGLAVQLDSGNWLLTPKGFAFLNREGLRCLGSVPVSARCRRKRVVKDCCAFPNTPISYCAPSYGRCRRIRAKGYTTNCSQPDYFSDPADKAPKRGAHGRFVKRT